MRILEDMETGGAASTMLCMLLYPPKQSARTDCIGRNTTVVEIVDTLRRLPTSYP